MNFETLKIDLKAMKEDRKELSFFLQDDYFTELEGSEVVGGNVQVSIDIQRINDNLFTLKFHETGTVVVNCDVCLDPMDQPMEAEERLEVKFGKEYSEEDNLVTVAEDEGILDVSWFLYEFIELQIPIRHVHAPGKCNPAMIRMLEEHSAARSGEEDESKPIDPRWETLLKLKK